MKNLEKIETGTDNGAFDWILEDERHATYDVNNSNMIRKLVYRHNQMVDQINMLTAILKSENELGASNALD